MGLFGSRRRHRDGLGSYPPGMVVMPEVEIPVEEIDIGNMPRALPDSFDERAAILRRAAEIASDPTVKAAYEESAAYYEERRCPRDSDWCDGEICKQHGVQCPRAKGATM